MDDVLAESLARMPRAAMAYTVWYLVLFALHVVFVQLAFSGAAFLAITSIPLPRRRRSRFGERSPPHSDAGSASYARFLTRGLPWITLAAMGAGAATAIPWILLYRDHFVQLNLLLWHRVMALLPALILGFFMLVVAGSWGVGRRMPLARGVAAVGACIAFGIAGYIFSENHLLHIDSQVWDGLYSEADPDVGLPRLTPRLLTFLALAVTSWAAHAAARARRRDEAVYARGIAVVAMVALVGSVIAASWVVSVSPDPVRGALTHRYSLAVLASAGTGLALQVVAWFGCFQCRSFTGVPWWVTVSGCALTVGAAVVLREIYRIASLGTDPNFQESLDRLAPPVSPWALTACAVASAALASLALYFWRRGRRAFLQGANEDEAGTE